METLIQEKGRNAEDDTNLGLARPRRPLPTASGGREVGAGVVQSRNSNHKEGNDGLR